MKILILQKKHIPPVDTPLWNEILNFNRNKYFWALLLILISFSGIIIPIIPGLFIFILGIALLRKGWMARLRRRFRLWKI